MTRSLGAILALALAAVPPAASQGAGPGRLSNAGVRRATAVVDSVFIDRTKAEGQIEGGDWAAYLLARLGTGPIPDSLGITVSVDTAHIEVSGRLQDLPPEARALLGPLASAVDSSTVVVADITLSRPGPEVVRFWLRRLLVNGYQFPEFLLAPMMARVGRQYPALTGTGRVLYVQIPPDGSIALGPDVVRVATTPPTQEGETEGRRHQP